MFAFGSTLLPDGVLSRSFIAFSWSDNDVQIDFPQDLESSLRCQSRRDSGTLIEDSSFQRVTFAWPMQISQSKKEMSTSLHLTSMGL
mmetsp:Transcript_25695/g.73940  ORF Transcript_25695/g.73940 Transcript_25695/m.73940 type:complete len:87 (+) Transcript_25695:162-422(+)